MPIKIFVLHDSGIYIFRRQKDDQKFKIIQKII